MMGGGLPVPSNQVPAASCHSKNIVGPDATTPKIVPVKSADEPAVAKRTVTRLAPAGNDGAKMLQNVPPAKIVHVPTVAPGRVIVTTMSVAIIAEIYGCSVAFVSGRYAVDPINLSVPAGAAGALTSPVVPKKACSVAWAGETATKVKAAKVIAATATALKAANVGLIFMKPD
jgi:hypothetical protein